MSTHQDLRPETSGPSIATIVWGAVVIVAGGLMLANRLGWFSIDPGYAAAGILLVAGLALVVGGIAASHRRHAATHDAGQGTSGGHGADAAVVTASNSGAADHRPSPGAADTPRPSPYDSLTGHTGRHDGPAAD